jgi:hypothetical protein
MFQIHSGIDMFTIYQDNFLFNIKTLLIQIILVLKKKLQSNNIFN